MPRYTGAGNVYYRRSWCAFHDCRQIYTHKLPPVIALLFPYPAISVLASYCYYRLGKYTRLPVITTLRCIIHHAARVRPNRNYVNELWHINNYHRIMWNAFYNFSPFNQTLLCATAIPSHFIQFAFGKRAQRITDTMARCYICNLYLIEYELRSSWRREYAVRKISANGEAIDNIGRYDTRNFVTNRLKQIRFRAPLAQQKRNTFARLNVNKRAKSGNAKISRYIYFGRRRRKENRDSNSRVETGTNQTPHSPHTRSGCNETFNEGRMKWIAAEAGPSRHLK